MNFEGVIIEESLTDATVLNEVSILSTKVEPVTEKHKTPWVEQWTLRTVSIPPDNATHIAEVLSKVIDTSHKSSWYADFKSDTIHYIIFPEKVFRIDRTKKEEYQAATEYGLTLGIPDYQLDFAPNVVQWDR